MQSEIAETSEGERGWTTANEDEATQGDTVGPPGGSPTGTYRRRLGDLNPGWAINPNRISSAAP